VQCKLGHVTPQNRVSGGGGGAPRPEAGERDARIARGQLAHPPSSRAKAPELRGMPYRGTSLIGVRSAVWVTVSPGGIASGASSPEAS
jgi:hypothetical protein